MQGRVLVWKHMERHYASARKVEQEPGWSQSLQPAKVHTVASGVAVQKVDGCCQTVARLQLGLTIGRVAEVVANRAASGTLTTSVIVWLDEWT